EICKTHLVVLLRTIFYVCGFYKLTIVQKGDIEKEKDAPIYIFAPHTSLFDVLAGVAFNAPSSVAKADIIDIPLFGNIFKLSDPVLVERDSANSRQDVFKKVAEAIKYSKIVFFPEGTCSNHRVLLQFKNGAFKFGYPVIPVAIRFNQFGGPDTLSWTWDGPSTLASIWLTLARWRTDIEVTKLPVYYPSEAEKADPDLYARNVTQVLVKELQVPCLFYSFDDARYLKYKFFRSSACVKFLKLCDKIRQMRQQSTTTESTNGGNNHSTIKPNGDSGATSNGKVKTGKAASQARPKSHETLFTSFLHQYIDEIEQNLNKYDLNTPLDSKFLVKVLNAENIPGICDSNSVKEFLYSVEKLNEGTRLLHLKMVLCFTDLRVDDLWERMRNCYEAIAVQEKGNISFETLKTLLWLALSLEEVDCDEEVKNIKILSFDDLKNMIVNYYDFALRENANSISQEGLSLAVK
ncbi:PREDICTED: lysophosphatidylcholine acyltransferase 1-like, partial [Rhagoletis zephyria]|uniref:lysophosphatidylcholine acyltransferase 1-like n=1 Tax=Rhagoletis zephyria TaxID=28612 RepID=UPI000811965C